MPRPIDKATAIEAVQRAWEMVQASLSPEDHIEAAEELSSHFDIVAEAAREDEA